MTQPEAIRLSRALLTSGWEPTQQEKIEAAAELRRLHEENERLRQALAQPEQEPVQSVNHVAIPLKEMK